MKPLLACAQACALACAVGCCQPSAARETAGQVLQVFPSAGAVPENLLRIELRFAQPLRTPLEAGQIHLLDATGQEVVQPFLDLVLPSADGRRMTVLMHPARLKTGVGANLSAGRALHAGEPVTLVVDHPSLRHPVEQKWMVDAPDVQSPQPTQWRITAPVSGSRQALRVQLVEAVSASAEGLIAVRGPGGGRVAGVAALEDGETVWRFTPARPWPAGRYTLQVHPDMEDAAGNRACALFEMPKASTARCDEGASLPFQVRTR